MNDIVPIDTTITTIKLFPQYMLYGNRTGMGDNLVFLLFPINLRTVLELVPYMYYPKKITTKIKKLCKINIANSIINDIESKYDNKYLIKQNSINDAEIIRYMLELIKKS